MIGGIDGGGAYFSGPLQKKGWQSQKVRWHYQDKIVEQRMHQTYEYTKVANSFASTCNR